MTYRVATSGYTLNHLLEPIEDHAVIVEAANAQDAEEQGAAILGTSFVAVVEVAS